jgi:drug/metabolite transporter (DMT)-like permease
MRDRLIGYACLALAMATVGSTVIASRVIAGDLPPFLATALRFALALPVFLVILAFARATWPRLTRRAWLVLAVQAGAGSVGYTTLLIAGLAHMPAADAGVVIGTLPAVSALFSVAVLGERPHRRLLVSVALATAGVLAVAWSGRGGGSWLGAALVLGAVLCESTFILLNKRLAVPLAPLLQATAMTALGLAVSAPFALLEFGRADWTAPALAAVAWYALVPTVGGFLLWYAGAARVTGTEAATFTAVAPVTAVAGAALVLGETVGPAQIAGMLAVLGAIAILSLPTRTGARAA